VTIVAARLAELGIFLANVVQLLHGGIVGLAGLRGASEQHVKMNRLASFRGGIGIVDVNFHVHSPLDVKVDAVGFHSEPTASRLRYSGAAGARF
jgi:hypothetical protein